VYGRNSDKGGDLTDVGASAIGSAINKKFNLMDAGCRPLHFLLVINTNLPPILHRFRDIAFDRSKVAILATPLAFNPPTEGFPPYIISS